jgi:chitodextrinase
MASYYGIYRDNIEAATTTETSFTDTGLVASTTYTYTVAAYNASGSVSSPSASVSGTTDQLTLISSSTACIGQYTPILAEIQQATSTQAVEALAEGAGLQIASSTQSDSFDDLDSLTTVTITAPCSTTVLASVTEYDDVFQVNTSSSAATPIDLKEMSATSSIQLSWKEFPAEYVTDYVIYRSPQDTTTSTPSTDFEQIGTSLTTSFIDDTALANTKYNYEVAASDAWGDASAPSAPLNDVSYSTPFSLAPPALSPVQGLSASVSGNTVNLSWQANQPNNDNELYYIYRTTTSGCAATSTMFEGIANWNEYWQTLTQFTDAYVPPGTYYYCVADAPDGSGLPGASAPVDASTVSTPLAVTVTQTLGTPPPPQIPSVSGYTLAPAIGYSSVTTSTISLAWTDDQTQVVAGEVTGQALESPYTGTAGFDIYRNGVFVGTSATTSYMDTGLTPSTTYHYSVAAYTKNGGTSSKTPTTVLGFIPAGDITTLTQSEIPPQMQGLAATVSGNAVQLVWGDTTDTVMVFRAPTPDCEATSTDFVAETNNPYFIDDDLPLSTYYYCIAEYDDVQVWDNGYPATVDLDYPNVGSESYALLGPVSAPIQATVAAPSSLPPSVPTGLTVTATTLSSISLSWSPSREPSEYAGGSLAGYRIYRNGVEIATTKGTSFTDTDLIEYTPYLYTVAAYDDQGTVSGQSINVGGTPLPSGNNDTSSGPDSVNITTSITSPLSFIPALESMPTIIGRFISAVIGVPTAYAQTVPVVGNNTGGPASCAIAGSNGQAYVLVTAGGMLDGVSSNYSFSITQNSNSTPWSSAVALDVINAFANINALGGVQGTPAGSMPTANAIGAVLDYINIQSEPVGAIGLSWDVDTLQAMGTTYNNSCLATAIVNNLVANSNNGAPDMSNSTYMTNIFMHEIGHCLGLDHVDDPNNIMNPAVPEGASTFNAAQIQFLQDVAAGKTIQVDPTTCKTKCDPNYAWSQTANRCVLVNTLCNPAVFPNSVWNQVVQSCLQCPADTYANTNTNTCVPISHDAWVSYELPPTTCSFSTDGNGEPNTYSCTDGIDCNCQTNGLVTCINGSGDDIAAPPDACQGGCPDGEIQATGGDDSGCVANCSLNPFDPSCGQAMCGSSDLALSDVGSCVAAACVGDPTGQDCADYCDANPGAPGCPDSDYCQQNPLDPTCFCASYPDDPSCTGESGNAGSSGDNGDTSAANTTQPFANSSLNTETALAISSSSGMTSVIVRTQNTSISNQTAIINQALGELLNELAAFLKRL